MCFVHCYWCNPWGIARQTPSTCIGNGRFARLVEAAQQQEPKPPVDLRYLKKEQGHAVEVVHLPGVLSFLESVYTSIAETLPDVRDVLSGAKPDEDDPYCQAFDDQSSVPKKRMRRGVMIAEGRTVQDGCQEKWLPCGTMKEYWVQYKQQSSDNAASFPTFWRAWASHYSFMRFRGASSHAQCILVCTWLAKCEILV